MYIKFEYWGRENTKWFNWYKCGDFKLLTLFKFLHWRICRNKEEYDNLPQCG